MRMLSSIWLAAKTQRRSFQVLRRGGKLISAVSRPDQHLAQTHGVEAAFFLVNVTSQFLAEIQERQFERLGGGRVIRADVRVIAATNRDLFAAIAAGTFRADLFYRLNVFPIEVPPLRKRREDIPILVEYFVKRFAEKMAKPIRKIDKGYTRALHKIPVAGQCSRVAEHRRAIRDSL